MQSILRSPTIGEMTQPILTSSWETQDPNEWQSSVTLVLFCCLQQTLSSSYIHSCLFVFDSLGWEYLSISIWKQQEIRKWALYSEFENATWSLVNSHLTLRFCMWEIETKTLTCSGRLKMRWCMSKHLADCLTESALMSCSVILHVEVGNISLHDK